MISVLDGQAAMVFGSGDGGVHAWQPRTGKPIWNFNFSLRGLNISPVVVDGNGLHRRSRRRTSATPHRWARILGIDGKGTGDITKTGEVVAHAGHGRQELAAGGRRAAVRL